MTIFINKLEKEHVFFSMFFKYIIIIGGRMKLLYNNKDIDLYECKSFFSRLKGFMFTRNIDKALLFDRCNSIHTFFMKENIDVIMCDNDNKVLFVYKDLTKNKIILPKKGVRKVFETPSGYFDIKINERMIIK